MDKNQKMLLGVAVVGVGAYLLWKSKQPKKATFMKSADGCPAGSVVVNGTGNDVNRAYCMNTKTQRITKRLNADGLKGVKGLGNGKKRMVGMSGGKRMVGMINNDKVKAGPFGKRNLINSTNVQEGSFKKNLINSTSVQEGSFKTFTPENLGSDLLSVKNSNFFDQNILGSKFS